MLNANKIIRQGSWLENVIFYKEDREKKCTRTIKVRDKYFSRKIWEASRWYTQQKISS
jgi:hypothetical protein